MFYFAFLPVLHAEVISDVRPPFQMPPWAIDAEEGGDLSLLNCTEWRPAVVQACFDWSGPLAHTLTLRACSTLGPFISAAAAAAAACVVFLAGFSLFGFISIVTVVVFSLVVIIIIFIIIFIIKYNMYFSVYTRTFFSFSTFVVVI